MKIHCIFYYLITIIVLFAACKKDVSVPVTDIKLNTNELILSAGDTTTLMATVQPDNADNKTVTWTSDNPAVATVSQEGLVTAIADGQTTINATTQDDGKTATCSVNVDYRNKWTGYYDFNIHEMTHGFWEEDSTYFYSGSISKLAAQNKILVDWGNKGIINISGVVFTQKSTLTVDLDGKLSYPEYGGFGNTYFSSKSHISGDTIHFFISAGALGLWFTWDVVGHKNTK